MTINTLLAFTLPMILTASAFGQTIYKCPSPTPGAPPIIQQMPCTPAGGGETMQVKPLQSTGSTLEINEQGREYMTSNKERWEKQATDEKAERERQQALAAEHRKARAAEEQAAAQRATARAIWATGRRW
jgi:hypothetical protein